MKVYVCAKSQVSEKTSKLGVTHVLSLLEKHDKVYLHPKTPLQNWHRVNFDDVISEESIYAPKREDVENFLNWAKNLPDDAVLLVHCFAGVSRSTAAALSILVQYHGKDKLDDCVNMLLDVRSQAMPNPLIAKYADEILGCNGKLNDAVQKINSDKAFKIYPKI